MSAPAPPVLWQPSAERVERATLTRYQRWLEQRSGRRFGSYDELWRWSVDELEDFWRSIWDFFEVEAATPYSEVLRERIMPGAKWFEGAQLNYAQHVFRGKPDSGVAILHASELRDLDQVARSRARSARSSSSVAGRIT